MSLFGGLNPARSTITFYISRPLLEARRGHWRGSVWRLDDDVFSKEACLCLGIQELVYYQRKGNIH